MQKGKDIRFKHSWWQSLRLFTRDVRDEVFCAICEYGMEQKEPEELSDIARGIFSQIRIDIDERTAHEDQVRETRKRTGRLGAAKTNAIRWGESQQTSAKVGKCQQMSANADKTAENSAELSANADNSSAKVGKCQQMSANADKTAENSAELSANADNSSAKVGKCQQMSAISPDPSINNIYNYILSLTQTRTPAYEKVVSWLTDDEEKLQMLFYRSGIITEALQGEELAKIAAPYIEAYFNAMEFATDWEMKGRRDTKAHFNNWLRTHKVLNDGKQESTVHANTGRSTPKTTERATPDYDAEF